MQTRNQNSNPHVDQAQGTLKPLPHTQRYESIEEKQVGGTEASRPGGTEEVVVEVDSTGLEEVVGIGASKVAEAVEAIGVAEVVA
ncbi:hypothetical protein Taro_031084 [Colocasia esculenta]|uniref:Uncharacterized protein n=1 Tax=Colocasia esculenta TaxID=4460 RepID=A0A843VQX5_COLES|nr:hypothetical protein [Colocasia esculenta]